MWLDRVIVSVFELLQRIPLVATMHHSILPLAGKESARKSIRIVTDHEYENNLLVSNNMDVHLRQKLASRFGVTQFTTDVQLDIFDAYIVDCRGTSITSSELKGSFEFDIAFALVNEDSYLTANASEQDTKLELVTEDELTSDIFALRLASRLRAVKFQEQKRTESQDIVKENAYEILQTLMAYSTDWVVVKDLDHRFAMVTNRFLEAYNYETKDVIGKNDLEIGTPEELVLGNSDNDWEGFWKRDDKVIASKLPEESEHLVIHENALEQAREHVAKVPLKDKNGNVFGLFVCVTQAHSLKVNGDTVSTLTSRRNIESSPILKQLDDDRTKAEALSKQTQTTMKRKNNFIATASHDLRQPLQAIGLFIESLNQQITDVDQKKTLAKMKQSSRDLNELLNSILDISKLDAEAVTVNRTHFKLAPLLKSIEDEFESEALRKSIALHISSSNSVVHTDNLLLSRILKNLINNAVKYTTNGSVNLLTEVDEDHLIIRVKDTGPGIPKEQYQTVFNEYHQIEEQHTQPNFGQGLGLSIVKRLVELLKLDITLDSEADRGTQFTLTVPLGELQVDKSESQPLCTDKFSDSFKLMIIDDNHAVLESMEAMLTSMNCDAYPAFDIPEAEEIINELDHVPDLLIVDYQLADGVTGDTAINHLRKITGKDIPAIIVTGNTNSTLVRKATKSAYRVLNKPVNPDALLSTINSAIQENSLEPA